MANKKYISFDLTNEDDKKIVSGLKKIDLVLETKPKEILGKAVIDIIASEEFKKAWSEVLEEDLS